MLPKPSDIKPYEDETLERIQFEHLMIALIILEAEIIISILVFLGARRLKKTGIEEAVTENIDMADGDDKCNEDDYTMDEKKYAAWKRWCKYFCIVLIAALPFCITALSYHIHILIQAEQEVTTTSPEDTN